ncbi:hypothetical protein HII31_04181 [Pseudocercospora fuligena]|uniref:Uncharacterized protein n=1 Tax=Pseudocercospora fuligena TaxID=685502 RepID=A0A8H6RQF7_9PEZI|nr:hypothetical protein HII31_04181 [Pseudocercospora fuligena]
MPGVLGAPPGVTFNSTRTVTTNGLIDDLDELHLNGDLIPVNPKKRRHHQARTNGVPNGLSSRKADPNDPDAPEPDSDPSQEEVMKNILQGMGVIPTDEEQEKANAEEKERERQAEENRKEEERRIEEERQAALKAAKEKAEKEAKEAAAAAAAAASAKDDATIHLKQYNEARANVYRDLDDFRTSLDKILELLETHVHPTDWVVISMHNQSARQYNASIDDRYSTKLAALRNAKGLVQDTEVTIDQLEQLEPTEKLKILEKLGSTHVFPSPAEGAGQDKKDQYFRLLTNQLRVAVGLSSNAGP